MGVKNGVTEKYPTDTYLARCTGAELISQSRKACSGAIHLSKNMPPWKCPGKRDIATIGNH